MKINEEQRKEIVKRYTKFRKAYAKIRVNNLENLANEYGVSSARISKIVKSARLLTREEND